MFDPKSAPAEPPPIGAGVRGSPDDRWVFTEENPRRALLRAATLAGRAAETTPGDARYAWTEAYSLEKGGDTEGAVRVLERLVTRHPGYRDGWPLLGALHEGRGRAAVRAVYERAARTPSRSRLPTGPSSWPARRSAAPSRRAGAARSRGERGCPVRAGGSRRLAAAVLDGSV